MSARAAAILAMAGALVLAGCGFRPLYGKESFPEGAEATFAGIEIAPVASTNDSDRIGDLVSDALDIAMHPPGVRAPMAHRLVVTLADERRGLAIQDDASITRYNYRLTADWTLTPKGSETPVASGTAETTASYNVVDSQYATLVAREDGERRAAREVAQLIKLRIAAALAAP